MKVFYGIVVLAVLMFATNAEPPRRFNNNQRQQNFGFFQRQQELTPPAANAPYPPSGWKPKDKSFVFPSGQQQQQPPQKYGPPPTEYGPPQQPESTTNYQDYTTINAEAESIQDNKRKNEKQVKSSSFQNTDRGFYYVYLPDGRLQRVIYMTSADLQNMAYTARVQYQDVDPVSAPIYSAVNRAPVVSGERLIVQQIK